MRIVNRSKATLGERCRRLPLRLFNVWRARSQLSDAHFTKGFADRSDGQRQSAIQITTAAGICTAVDLFREKRLPQRGFVRQEQIGLPEFLANRFGQAYQQFRHIESIS